MEVKAALPLVFARSSADEAAADMRYMAFPSRVEIDLGALAFNTRWIKARVGADIALMAVVKANAYGHGAVAVARAALQNGADMLAVANLAEAFELRDAGLDAPLLILSYVPAGAIPAAIDYGLRLPIFDRAFAERCVAVARRADGELKVHLKVDTGMGRLGVLPRAVGAICRLLRDAPGIILDGVYTHFATADDDPPYMKKQLRAFNRVLAQLRTDGTHVKYIHAANSAALLNGFESYFNVVRPGVLLYGLAPMPGGRLAECLRPAMSWKSQVAQVKTLPPDSRVGYGNEYRTRGEEAIAVVPVGYADGLRRTPYTWREVLIRGKRAPLAGRVSMEKITVDVSHIPGVSVGDEVTLLGQQGGESISADEIAGWIRSNNYEVVTSIAPRIPRAYLSD